MNPSREPNYMHSGVRQHHRRGDLSFEHRGVVTIVDVTVRFPECLTHLPAECRNPGHTLSQAIHAKEEQCRHFASAQGALFVAAAMTPFTWSDQVECVLRSIASATRYLHHLSSQPPAFVGSALTRLRRQLSTQLWQANAEMVERMYGTHPYMNPACQHASQATNLGATASNSQDHTMPMDPPPAMPNVVEKRSRGPGRPTGSTRKQSKVTCAPKPSPVIGASRTPPAREPPLRITVGPSDLISDHPPTTVGPLTLPFNLGKLKGVPRKFATVC